MRCALFAAAIAVCTASQPRPSDEAKTFVATLASQVNEMFNLDYTPPSIYMLVAQKTVELLTTVTQTLPSQFKFDDSPDIIEALAVAAYDLYTGPLISERNDFFVLKSVIEKYLQPDMILLESKFDGKRHAKPKSCSQKLKMIWYTKAMNVVMSRSNSLVWTDAYKVTERMLPAKEWDVHAFTQFFALWCSMPNAITVRHETLKKAKETGFTEVVQLVEAALNKLAMSNN